MNRPPVRYLVLWLTTSCNLHCTYCYRSWEPPATMSQEVIRAALSLAASSGLPFHVQLAGGEPTLEPALIEYVGKTVRGSQWHATIALQTNGTLLDRPLATLCQTYDIKVGVSLDGPPHIQESLRGNSGAAFRGLFLLERMAIPVNITTVLSSVNSGYLEDLLLTLVRFRNIRGLGLDPIILKGKAQGNLALLPSYEMIRSGIQMLLNLFRSIDQDQGTTFRWRELEAVRRALAGGSSSRPYCHACHGESIAVHPDGTVYPCAQTIGDPEMAVGKIGSIDGKKLLNCYQGLRLQGDCTTCPLFERCPGDCLSRLRYNEGIHSDSMCILYRTIAESLIDDLS